MSNIIIPPSPMATFSVNNSRASINKIKVLFAPAQDGEGIPSVDNIRPIAAREEANFYHSGADTSNPVTHSMPFSGVSALIYGGTLDLISGILTSEYGIITMNGTGSANSGLSFSGKASQNRCNQFYCYVPNASSRRYSISTIVSGNVCSHAIEPETDLLNVDVPVGQLYFLTYYNNGSTNKYQPRLAWPLSSEINSVAKANNWLKEQYDAGTPVRYTYYLNTPVEYQLTGEEITAFVGENNIWADIGDVSVEYYDGTNVIIKLNDEDVTDYFTPRGMKVSYVKVQGKNGGTYLSGDREEDVLAWKAVVQLTCMPLTDAQQANILTKVTSENPTLYYFDPRLNSYRTIHYMASIEQVRHRGAGGTGVEYWTGLVLTAEEK